jgi:hypothetical protein
MRTGYLVVSLAVLGLMASASALADSTQQIFSKVGSWVIAKKAPNHCVAHALGSEDVVSIDTDGKAVYIELTNDRLQMPNGTYPIGLEMNSFSETRYGWVASGFPHTIVVALEPADLTAFRRTGWVKFDLGQRWRFMNLDDNEGALRMLSICEHNENDPFAKVK